MPDDKRKAIRDYWLQFHRKKKFSLPEELEEVINADKIEKKKKSCSCC